MNEVAQTFLTAYANGQEAEGGWKYGKALLQSKLDYSDASLKRLDLLLTAIRVRAKPTAQEMLGTEPGRNFCSLVAFYVIEMLRRRCGAYCEWHDPDSIARILPPGVSLPQGHSMRLIACFPDQAGLFWPLAWVEDQINPEATQESAADYIADLIRQLEQRAPIDWWSGAHALGRIASWQMMMAAEGSVVSPLMLGSTAPTTWLALVAPMSQEKVSEVLERGARRLESNPDGAVWQVLAYDGYVELDGNRFDSIMVLMETYGPTPLQLKIGFPYVPAGDGRSFAILDPTLIGANVAFEKVSMINGALERGIQSIAWAFGKTWNQLRKQTPG